MIRLARGTEDKELTYLWLNVSIFSHPFIRAGFWQQRANAVEHNYLRTSVTYVAEEDGEIVGFISFVRKGFIGGIFVAQKQQGKGIGTLLLGQAKKMFATLELDVYVKNKAALAFYKQQDFIPVMVYAGTKTGEDSFRMRWDR